MIRLASRRLPRRPRKHACGHRWRSRSKPARRGSPTRAFARGTQRAWPRRRLHIHDDGGIERPSCHLARTTTTIEGTRAAHASAACANIARGADKTRQTRPPPCSSKRRFKTALSAVVPGMALAKLAHACQKTRTTQEGLFSRLIQPQPILLSRLQPRPLREKVVGAAHTTSARQAATTWARTHHHALVASRSRSLAS